MTSERQIYSNILAETIKELNGLRIKSTINNYLYVNSEEDDTESNPNSDPKVATYTTHGNYPHKLLTNREIPEIIQGVIPLVNQTTTDGVATSRGDLHTLRTVLHQDIVTGATRSTLGVIKDPLVINHRDAIGPIKVDKNTVGIPPRTTTQVLNGTGPSAYPIRIWRQKIEGTRRSIILQESRNAEPLDASINKYPVEHRDPTPGWSKIIGNKVVTDESVNIYMRGQTNFGSDTVLSKNPNFMNFGLLPVNTTDKLRSIIVLTARVGGPRNGSNWLQSGHDIEEAKLDRVRKTKANNHYNFKSYFKTMREIQYFEQENISMS